MFSEGALVSPITVRRCFGDGEHRPGFGAGSLDGVLTASGPFLGPRLRVPPPLLRGGLDAAVWHRLALTRSSAGGGSLHRECEGSGCAETRNSAACLSRACRGRLLLWLRFGLNHLHQTVVLRQDLGDAARLLLDLGP